MKRSDFLKTIALIPFVPKVLIANDEDETVNFIKFDHTQFITEHHFDIEFLASEFRKTSANVQEAFSNRRIIRITGEYNDEYRIAEGVIQKFKVKNIVGEGIIVKLKLKK